ncbi:hypothetical protein Tco_1162892 [Tanacetum coccineum]
MAKMWLALGVSWRYPFACHIGLAKKWRSHPTSVVRNTLGKEPVPQDPGRPISDEALREYCDRNYYQILPIIVEKVHQEKAQQEKLKAVKARLNFEDTSRHSESGTPIRRKDLKERLGPRYVRGRSGNPEPRRGRSESPKKKGSERKTVFKGLEKVATETLKAATKVLVQRQRNPFPRDVITKGRPRRKQRSCQKVKVALEVIGNQNGSALRKGG